MNLTEQQTPKSQQSEQAAFVLTTPVSTNPLAQLENRMNSMSSAIVTLKNKVRAMQEVISHREQRIASLETENATLNQKMEQFAGSHDQLLDGLASMLARFPGEESLEDPSAENTSAQMDLLEETVGTA